jgi:uncharacterized protein GlcG (DUF336 family)
MADVTLSQAETIIDAVLAQARKDGLAPMTVAVLDRGGHLVALKRQDSSGILRVEIATGKAWGALGMGFGSRELANRAAKNPSFIVALTAASQGRVVPNPGGVLILDSASQIIGAVGISGDTADADEKCAVVAITSVGLTPATG